ncbi:hypothetical protein [Nostoc sp. PCC 9305]
MYDDSAQGENDDDKKPKSLLDMNCNKLGRDRAMPGLGYACAKID